METQRKQERPEVLSLIVKTQAGDEVAFSELFSLYTNLIDSQCHQYAEGAPSEQELRSEAIAAFWHAACKYDTAQAEVTFGLYARICISNQLISCQRKWRRMSPPISLDTEEMETLGADEKSDPAYYVLEREGYLALQKRMEAVLSPAEKQIWLLFVTGRTAAEIAAELQKDKRSVENAIFRARKKLRASFSETP